MCSNIIKYSLFVHVFDAHKSDVTRRMKIMKSSERNRKKKKTRI